MIIKFKQPKPEPKRGDIEYRKSRCIVPLYWKRKIYWLEKVTLEYTLKVPIGWPEHINASDWFLTNVKEGWD